MFGYLDIDKGTLEDGQRGLWQTFMCGLCFSTKKLYGNFPRMFITNDVNFFNVLFHSILGCDVEIEHSRCFSHPFKKQTVLRQTELIDRLATANVLLTYWNIYDDTIDGGSFSKKTALKAFSRAYNRAKRNFSALNDMLATRYGELREMETSGVDGIDRIAHAFAQLSEDFATLVLQEYATDHVKTLCYNLGKWIYLIDALDDAEKDLRKKEYNPFVTHYGAKSFDELKSQRDELQFEMFAVLNRVASAYNDLNLQKYTCLLDNVVYKSIRNKTNDILHKYTDFVGE
ncbi:MAG: hypothetical protein J1F66_03485 [Clostridiales bacterium]|nr:hypothetical protein [Clostridiales bacterium]